MNEVMFWKVIGLCNILEQRSSLGDWNLAFTPFVITDWWKPGNLRLEGENQFNTEGLCTAAAQVSYLSGCSDVAPSSKPAMALRFITLINRKALSINSI